MADINFIPASTCSLEQITHAFNLGFEGYYLPMSQTPDGLAQMMRENDVRLADSTALTIDGALAGIGLIGVRETRGWIAGMGVAMAWRDQGIGKRLLGVLLDHMREIGLRHAQLEALEINTPALALYQRMGFRAQRRLAVYHGPLRPSEGQAPGVAAGGHTRMHSVAPHMALKRFDQYHAVAPAWQRERATLERVRGALDGLGLWDGARLSAYVLFSRQTGGYALLDAGSLAPDAAARRNDIVRLLHALSDTAPEATFRAINAPPGDALGDALDLLGCPVALAQQEMARALP